MSTEYIKTNWQDGDIITAGKMNNIENGIKGLEQVGTELRNDVDDLADFITVAVGSPLVANTVAEMTDTKKIYVYTGSETGYINGNWYYYDGTNWQSGGAYNSTAVTTDKTLTNQDVPADAKAVGDELTDLKADLTQAQTDLENKANIDGSYDTMTVGNAKQLTSNVGINDKAPYLFRTAGGANDIGDREEDTIVGGSIVWNQLVKVPSSDVSKTANGVTFTDNRDGSVTVSTDANGATADTSITFTDLVTIMSGHKYLITGCPSGGSSSTYWFRLTSSIYDVGNGKIYDRESSATNAWYPTIEIKSGTVITTPIKFKPNIKDITQMFGSTIANYIYSLEQATAGAGVAWFRKLFPKDYYPYSAPTFKHVEGLAAHKIVGFNAWDEQWEQGTFNTTTGANIAGTSQIRSKNLIPILPQTNYFWKCPYFAWFIFYDANKNVIYPTGTSGDGRSGNSISFLANTPFKTPIDAWYCRFYVGSSYGGTYKNNICLHLRWDGERDGEYEAYKVNTYPLDDSLTLKGIPKLDANNDLYYDGDTYEADGTVTRRYGVLDLGDLSWSSTGSGDTRFFYADITIYGFKSVQNNLLLVVDYPIIPIGSSDTNQGLGFASLSQVRIRDNSYSDAASLKAGVAGQKVLYEKATPTAETADPFQTPQIVDDWGTEEYVYADGAFPIPVGHDTFYAANLKAKLEMAPDSPGDGDGDYIVRQTNGLNEYVKMVKELPSVPTTDGSYHLEVTVASGTPTLTWVADE